MVRKRCTKLAVKQILSYFLFLFDLLVFTILILPDLSKLESLAYSLVFSISFGYLLIFGAYMTMMSPEVKGEVADTSKYDYYCEICRIYVNNTTKHCGRCQICVSGFDHHCEWINNCIGEKNYKHFIVLILSLEVYELLFIFIKVYYLVIYGYDDLLCIFIYANLAGSCIVLCANGFLLCFHAYLKLKNISTFEYIMSMKKTRQIIPVSIAQTDPNF